MAAFHLSIGIQLDAKTGPINGETTGNCDPSPRSGKPDGMRFIALWA
jgi:hypothetical protein